MLARLLATVCLTSLLYGCSTLAYYSQAAIGHFTVLNRARPIASILEDPNTSEHVKRKLKLASTLRNYASHELGLPDNKSYRSYADIGRRYLIWNVVTTPELSLIPITECFPIAGCLTYRGFFNEQAAKDYAAQKEQGGHDVFIYGVPAYSTLGWFHDPLVNTFLGYHDIELARLIFHELSHQLIYIKDDTAFNEAFATAVELEGTNQWLNQFGQHQTANSQIAIAEQRRQAFQTLLHGFRQSLTSTYASPQSTAEKRMAKHHIQAEYLSRYHAFKANWQGYSGYDHWFSPFPGNAHLASQATYHAFVPAFRQLFWENDRNWQRFYKQARKISKQTPAERAKMLHTLSERALARDVQQHNKLELQKNEEMPP
ncbi:aminopeptidase [Chitinivorax sp. B]|uniref:aminopeptidase n=1 Tax=Chitinivorax sp. B TaxID=2502235 RepID=UPI001485C0C3|nr:aminopeptidase [Chitinivorax sp. B]